MSGPDENPDTCMWELKSYTVLMAFCCDSPFASVDSVEDLIKKQATVTVVVRLQLSLWLRFSSNATSVRGALFHIR